MPEEQQGPAYTSSDAMPPMTWSDEPDVRLQFFGHVNDVLNAAMAADVLGFGWRADAYDAPVGPVDIDTTQREYRLVLWDDLKSDVSMFSPGDVGKTNPALVIEQAYLDWQRLDRPYGYREEMSFGEFVVRRLTGEPDQEVADAGEEGGESPQRSEGTGER